MTYATGGLIQATDLNGFVSTGTPNFNNIWSTGSGDAGYGQTAVNTVTAGTTVSFNPWNTLITNMASAAAHQGTTITAITPPVTGNLVSYLSALSTNLASINTNRLNAAAVGTDITTTGTRTASWGNNLSIPTVTSTITVTFASAAQARYFFNTGGAVLVSCSRTGGVGSPEDVSWSDLCTAVGSLGLPAVSTAQTIAAASYTGLTKFSGSGTPTIYTRSGYYNLTGTPAILFKQYSTTSAYTSDYVQLSYSTTATVLTITVQFTDSHTTSPVTGNLAVTAIARPSEITNIANSWGTPVVAVSAPA
jgi:hypothetical protein